MIAFLQGRLAEASPSHATMEVQGVGYEVLIPLSSYDKLPAVGQEVRLLTHLVVREDAHVLYGFATGPERELFRLLISTVGGIGPKTALSILSGMSPVAFRGAVATGDVKALARISGVGKKTAERIVVELKDKVGVAAGWEAGSAGRSVSPSEQRISDAAAALVALGFKPQEAMDTVRGAQAMLGVDTPLEDLVRAALRKRG